MHFDVNEKERERDERNLFKQIPAIIVTNGGKRGNIQQVNHDNKRQGNII